MTILVIITFVWELGILWMAFYNADEVECNLIYCKATTEYKDHIIKEHTYIEKYQSSNCYLNGVEINCSEVNEIVK